MPDPKLLRVGDRVRFVSLPEEWLSSHASVSQASIWFMNKMIARTWSSRVSSIDNTGYPWINARIRHRGRLHHHAWLITESTGWRVVRHRH